MSTPLLVAEDLTRQYRLPREHLLRSAPVVQALAGVSFTLQAGRSLGIVGESGSGKSTLARLVMALERPSSGRVVFDGQDLNALDTAALRRARAGFQMVFQDPYGSLDPRRKVLQTVSEPLAVLHGASRAEQRERAAEALEAVGLRSADLDKYPHEFSGGQRQRIAIARALITRPKLIVADEPVSALDVSVQAQVLNLLADLQRDLGLAYLFISHDLGVVQHIAHDVMVMYLGLVMEHGPKQRIFERPLHPYTRALLASTPRIDGAARRERIVLKGELPSPLNPPPGCVFSSRCPHAIDRCTQERPALRLLDERQVSCHLAEQFLASA